MDLVLHRAERLEIVIRRAVGSDFERWWISAFNAVICASNGAAEPAQRRKRRNISELIQHELSFSGQPTTTRQIAKAIEYHLEGTEMALSRMPKDGQVHRGEAGRWVIGMKTLIRVNGHAAGASTVKTAPVRPDSAAVRLP